MKKSNELLGLTIISISEGKEFGISKALVINAEKGSVEALVIEDEKWYLGAKLLSFNAIAGIGEYAVTVNSSEDIVSVANSPELEKLLEKNIKIIGTKVITKSGRIQGKISEYVIDETNGAIVLCELEDIAGSAVNEIDAASVMTYGKNVTIIAEKDDVISIKKNVSKVSNSEAPTTNSTPSNKVDMEDSSSDESTADVKLDERHRKYLVGKKASREITTDSGIVIVEEGGEITEEVLQKAKIAGKFIELSMNIQ